MADDQQILQALRQFVSESSVEDVRNAFRPGGEALEFALLLRPENYTQIMFEKNLKIFGDVNGYLDDYLPIVLHHVQTLPFPQKEAFKKSARVILDKMLNADGLSQQSRQRIEDALNGPLRSETTAPAAGKRRRRRKTRRV